MYISYNIHLSVCVCVFVCEQKVVRLVSKLIQNLQRTRQDFLTLLTEVGLNDISNVIKNLAMWENNSQQMFITTDTVWGINGIVGLYTKTFIL